MENYFVVLQLPDSRDLKLFKDNKVMHNFWERAAHAISSGKAKIVSRRQDTGISEDIRSHSEKAANFKTYVLVNVDLDEKAKKETIFAKAAKCIVRSNTAAVVETTSEFQLLAIGA